MRALRLLVPCALLLAACDNQAKQQLATLAHADSLRTDSLVSIKNDLLERGHDLDAVRQLDQRRDGEAEIEDAGEARRRRPRPSRQITDIKAQRAEV